MVLAEMELQIYLNTVWFWVGNQLVITIDKEELKETEEAYILGKTTIWKDIDGLRVKDCRDDERQEKAKKEANVNG
jgi:hypothetical protein